MPITKWLLYGGRCHLGLAIVDDLVRLYGGRVELTDSPLSGLQEVLNLQAA
jgi:signal transduction histidine kinase